MTRIRPALLATAALVFGACAIRPPGFVFPRSPQVTASAVPTALTTTWETGWPVVEVFIDGRGPWNFVLDSGAGPYVLDPRVADELKLERIDVSSGAQGVPVDDGHDRNAFLRQVARIRELRAGPLVERDTGAMVFDLSAAERATGVRIDGILPALAFRDGLLTLDYVGETVTVAAGELPPADGKEVLSLERGQLPCIEVEVGGASCLITIDSGSIHGLTLPAALEAGLRFRSRPVVVGLAGTIAGTMQEREGRLDGTIAWGRHRLEDPVVGLKSGDRGIAGMRLLREFRITFDFRHARVRFERAGDEPIRTASVRGSGFRCMYDRGAWTVAYVLNDGPAAGAGIHVGDRVEAIDGRAVADIGFAQWRTTMETGDALRLRVVGADGAPREVTVPVATLVE